LDFQVLTDDKAIALYFEEVIKYTDNYKSASNWVTVNIKSYLNEKAIEIEEFNVIPEKIGEIIKLIDSNQISNSVASQKVFPILIQTPQETPLSIAQENNLLQNSNQDEIVGLIKKAIEKYPEKVTEYKSGKTGLLGLFMGEVMKLSQGKADPKVANKYLREELEK
jgi:aspartyl-tRNA(Asn)/glutamyl-tRNA(Gln) amidotransferase subunit B